MKLLLVTNPAAGSSDGVSRDGLLRALQTLGSVEVVEPDADSLEQEVREAAADRDVIVCAGGDGTFNCTINALRERLADLEFVLLPLGTGNDLARTLGIAECDPLELAAGLPEGRRVALDVGVASGSGAERLFINACMGGFPVQVDEALDESQKERLGAAAFIWGGAKALVDLQRATVRVNGKAIERCVAVGVGNGRTCGGGIRVWPDADPSDGVLDACALPAEGPVDLARLAAKVKLGTHREIDDVLYERAESFLIDSNPQIEINVDGELVGLRTPASFELFTKTHMLLPERVEK